MSIKLLLDWKPTSSTTCDPLDGRVWMDENSERPCNALFKKKSVLTIVFCWSFYHGCLVHWGFRVKCCCQIHNWNMQSIYWVNSCKTSFYNAWMVHYYVCNPKQLHSISWQLTQIQCHRNNQMPQRTTLDWFNVLIFLFNAESISV